MLKQFKKTKSLIPPLALVLLLLLHACNNANQYQAAAPLGEISVLKALEKSYNTAANALPAAPTKLKPSVRRKFVEQVFQQAGYNYSATLMALAKTPSETINQHHKDMKELLFLPHHTLKFEDVKDVYTKEEQTAIVTINNII